MHGKKDYFYHLDGLRGIAALAVLVAHACVRIAGDPGLDRKHLAVQFFFMLSGFVVTCAYEDRLRRGYKISDFLLRRAIRLWPLIAAGTFMGTVTAFLLDRRFMMDPDNHIAVLFSAFVLPYGEAGFGFGLFPVNPPQWSLFFELLAYGAFALVFHNMSTRAMVLLIAAALAGMALLLIAYGHPPPLWVQSFGATASFGIGMILYRAYEAQKLPMVSLPFPVLAMLILAACAIPSVVPAAFDTLFVAVVAPAIVILGAASGQKPAGAMLKWLGDISSPLYILHWPILDVARYWVTPRFGVTWAIVTGCCASVAVAWVAFKYYDVPVRKLLSSKLKPSHVQPAVAIPAVAVLQRVLGE